MPALIYAAMDWLEGCQGAVEAELGRRHLASQASPVRMALFVSWTTWAGTDWPAQLCQRGTARVEYHRRGLRHRVGLQDVSTGAWPVVD